MTLRVISRVNKEYMAAAGLKAGEYPPDDALNDAAGKIPAASEAADHLQSATGLDPYFSEAHYLLGWSLIESGDMEGSQQAFARASRCAPRLKADRRDAPLLVRAIVARGQVLERSGRTQEARQEYERSLTLYPYLTPPMVRLGHLAADEGDATTAAQMFLDSFRPMFFVSAVPVMPRLESLKALVENARATGPNPTRR